MQSNTRPGWNDVPLDRGEAMRKSGLPLLQQLREEQLKLENDADEKNRLRRRNFQSWFKGNLWRRYITHTDGMELRPKIVSWLRTKKLDDTYRGSDKDTSTSIKGDHEYTSVTRLKWSSLAFRTALAIVLESNQLKTALLSGQPLSMHMVSDMVKELFNDSLKELITLHEPNSPYSLICNIKYPPGLLATATMEQLMEANVTIIFVVVNR